MKNLFNTIKQALKIKEVRDRLLFTLFAVFVIRIGCQIPLPGVNREYFSQWFSNLTGDSFNFFNSFTGGSFENMSVLALNITPFITASIIVELLTIAIPYLEELKHDGETGRKTMKNITRGVAAGLAFIESVAMAIGFHNQGIMDQSMNPVSAGTLMAFCLVLGSVFLMWLGEMITEKGLSEGTSLIIAVNILSRLPQDFASLTEMFIMPNIDSKKYIIAGVAGVAILVISVITVVLTVILNGAERIIPIQHSRRLSSTMVGGMESSIPLKVNTSGVIPVIFASSIMQFPVVICQLIGYQGGSGIGGKILRLLNSGNWFNAAVPVYTLGFVLYAVMVVFFAYFYTSIIFSPVELAENLKKQAACIPGIRPGNPTREYIENILKYTVLIGSFGLLIIAAIPMLASGLTGASVSFGGTSLLIVVSVVLETLNKTKARTLARTYKGFVLG